MNVDVVNRSQDRSQITLGIEFEYKDNLGGRPQLGVAMYRAGELNANQYFDCPPAELGKAKKGMLLIPVKFQPPSAQVARMGNYMTDQLAVYVADAGDPKQFNLIAKTASLVWRAPGYVEGMAQPQVAALPAPSAPAAPAAPAAPKIRAKLEWDEFKQSSLYKGYVTVKYELSSGSGKLRTRVFEAKTPKSAEWFDTPEITLGSSSGIELLPIAVKKDATSPADFITVDTIIVELLDDAGNVVAQIKKDNSMNWIRPK
jgi:hypothetical protein